MKAYLLVVALAVTAACGKQNDAHILQHEAVTLAKYYRPRVEALETRVQEIWKRGSTIPGNLPDVPELGRRLQEARDTIVQLKAIVALGPDQKSAVEKQAEAAAKENRVADLRKLVHDTEVTLERGITVINANLDTVESWMAQYDRKMLAMMTPAQPSESAPAAAGAGAGTPEAQATPQTGQPPAAAQPTPAQPTPAPVQPKAEQPKAEQPKAEQPKAEQPKPAQPKPAQPKPAQPKP